MNRRLLTSAVAIHATACVVAFLAVGPGQAGASSDANDLSEQLDLVQPANPLDMVFENEWSDARPAHDIDFENTSENLDEAYGLEGVTPVEPGTVVSGPTHH